MVTFQLTFKVSNASENEMLDAAIFIKDNYASILHQVSGNDKDFLMTGTFEMPDFPGLVSAIQAFKTEFGTRFSYGFTMDKESS